MMPELREAKNIPIIKRKLRKQVYSDHSDSMDSDNYRMDTGIREAAIRLNFDFLRDKVKKLKVVRSNASTVIRSKNHVRPSLSSLAKRDVINKNE